MCCRACQTAQIPHYRWRRWRTSKQRLVQGARSATLLQALETLHLLGDVYQSSAMLANTKLRHTVCFCAGITFKTGTKVVGVDIKNRSVSTEIGDQISFEKLIIALGSVVGFSSVSAKQVDRCPRNILLGLKVCGATLSRHQENHANAQHDVIGPPPLCMTASFSCQHPSLVPTNAPLPCACRLLTLPIQEQKVQTWRTYTTCETQWTLMP